MELMERVGPSATALWPLIQSPADNPTSRRHLAALRLAGTVGSGGTNGVPALIKALESTNPVVVSFALRSLASLGPVARDAMPALESASRDSNPTIGDAARCTFRKVRGER